MPRSLCYGLVAFACLFSIGNSDLGLMRDIRDPNNPNVQEYYNSRGQPVPAATHSAPSAYFAPAPPSLSSPGLVASVQPYAAPASVQPYAAPAASAAAPPPATVPPAAYGPPLPTAPTEYGPSLPAAQSAPVASFAPAAPVASAYASANRVDVRTSDEIASSILTFAQRLSNQINENENHKTTIFSPLSIVSALALLMLGAKGRSHAELSSLFGQRDTVKLHEQFSLMLQDVQQPTRQTTSPLRQLDPWHSNSVRRSLRNYPKNRHAPQEVHVANGLFVQQGYTLNPDYRQAVYEVYNSEVKPLDFEYDPTGAKNIINGWVEKHTRNKINNIISGDLPQSTRLILANALYFKAMWEIDFITGGTRVEDFYPHGEGTMPAIPVEMMAGAGAFPYYEDLNLNCRILGLPYHGNLTTMYVIQPMRSSVAQLSYLQQSLTADAIERMISQMIRRSIIVAFPKLHITESFKLQPLLSRMGFQGIFMGMQSDLALIGNEASRAPAYAPTNLGLGSLRNLNAQREAAMRPPLMPTPPADLIVSEILHKVDFEVNEQGTEAAAATAAVLRKSGPEVLFRADTPYIVLVRHDLTKLPLFYGVINEPPAAAPTAHRN